MSSFTLTITEKSEHVIPPSYRNLPRGELHPALEYYWSAWSDGKGDPKRDSHTVMVVEKADMALEAELGIFKHSAYKFWIPNPFYEPPISPTPYLDEQDTNLFNMLTMVNAQMDEAQAKKERLKNMSYVDDMLETHKRGADQLFDPTWDTSGDWDPEEPPSKVAKPTPNADALSTARNMSSLSCIPTPQSTLRSVTPSITISRVDTLVPHHRQQISVPQSSSDGIGSVDQTSRPPSSLASQSARPPSPSQSAPDTQFGSDRAASLQPGSRSNTPFSRPSSVNSNSSLFHDHDEELMHQLTSRGQTIQGQRSSLPNQQVQQSPSQQISAPQVERSLPKKSPPKVVKVQASKTQTPPKLALPPKLSFPNKSVPQSQFRQQVQAMFPQQQQSYCAVQDHALPDYQLSSMHQQQIQQHLQQATQRRLPLQEDHSRPQKIDPPLKYPQQSLHPAHSQAMATSQYHHAQRAGRGTPQQVPMVPRVIGMPAGSQNTAAGQQTSSKQQAQTSLQAGMQHKIAQGLTDNAAITRALQWNQQVQQLSQAHQNPQDQRNQQNRRNDQSQHASQCAPPAQGQLSTPLQSQQSRQTQGHSMAALPAMQSTQTSSIRHQTVTTPFDQRLMQATPATTNGMTNEQLQAALRRQEMEMEFLDNQKRLAERRASMLQARDSLNSSTALASPILTSNGESARSQSSRQRTSSSASLSMQATHVRPNTPQNQDVSSQPESSPTNGSGCETSQDVQARTPDSRHSSSSHSSSGANSASEQYQVASARKKLQHMLTTGPSPLREEARRLLACLDRGETSQVFAKFKNAADLNTQAQRSALSSQMRHRSTSQSVSPPELRRRLLTQQNLAQLQSVSPSQRQPPIDLTGSDPPSIDPALLTKTKHSGYFQMPSSQYTEQTASKNTGDDLFDPRKDQTSYHANSDIRRHIQAPFVNTNQKHLDSGGNISADTFGCESNQTVESTTDKSRRLANFLQPTNTLQASSMNNYAATRQSPPLTQNAQSAKKVKTKDFKIGSQANTNPIPPHIQQLVDSIKALRGRHSGLPSRKSLREFESTKKHFTSGGFLRSNSELQSWVGDNRLLSNKEWQFLKTWNEAYTRQYAYES